VFWAPLWEYPLIVFCLVPLCFAVYQGVSFRVLDLFPPRN
jgi:hypothetical protein